MIIRAEKEDDRDAVHAVNEAAFDTPSEADLADALRKQADPLVSLVADDSGQIVGHLILSPMSLSGDPDLAVMGLGPMAVSPEHQRKGIGSELVEAGLERCRQMHVAAVIVLGHPEYYPRFGFSPAARFGIKSEYDVPDEVFMAMELTPDALTGKSGTAKYHPAFAEA